jgi:hypothetical protein
MASWGALNAYIHSNYKVADESQGMIKLVFELRDGRSQMVLVERSTLLEGLEEWAIIESPFGRIDQVDTRAAIREVGDNVCGGIASSGDFITFRHSVPLANLDPNEFERPLQLVTTTADRLEVMFSGGDVF